MSPAILLFYVLNFINAVFMYMDFESRLATLSTYIAIFIWGECSKPLCSGLNTNVVYLPPCSRFVCVYRLVAKVMICVQSDIQQYIS